MCGIVGAVTPYLNGFDYKEAAMIQDMLYADTVRGFDSTGVFSVANNGNVHLLKEATPGFRFLATQDWKDFKSDLMKDGKFFVGHNRAATRGAVSDKNAHPFCVDDKIILVQNGTYKGSHRSLKDTEVDTEAVAHALAEETDIEKAMQKVNAAYALVWYDTRTQTLHMLRNDERPLWLAETQNDGFVFASEPGIIEFAATRHGVELKKKPYMFAEQTLGKVKLEKDKSFTEEYVKGDFKYKWVSYHTGGTPHHWLGDSDDNDDGYAALWGAPVDHSHHQRYKRKPDDIDYTAMQCIAGMRDACTYSREESDEYKKEFSTGAEVVVEALEYFPANNLTNCTKFHVIARAVVVEPEDEIKPMMFWTVGDTTREEVAQKYFTSILRVTIDYECSKASGNVKPPYQSYIGYSCKNVTPIVSIPHNEQTQHVQ